MEIHHHNMTATSAYLDLKEMHLRESISPILGQPVKQQRGKKAYWYDQFRVGREIQRRYLGKDTEDVRAVVTAHLDDRPNRTARMKRMAEIAGTLRANGFLRTDKDTGSLLLAMAKAGYFRLGGVMIGTHAFRAYEGELGVRIPHADQAANTGDVDIAAFQRLSVAIAETDSVDPGPSEIFSSLKFEAVPALRNNHTWKWRQASGEVEIEFLTPSFGGEPTRLIPSLGVAAKGLNHLDFLIKEPINAIINYRSGVLVKVPTPERFAVHKLIVAARRVEGPHPQKAIKDRAQAAFLIRVLAEERPLQLAEIYNEACQSGPGWQARIDQSLRLLPDEAKMIEEARNAFGI